jgi:RimJ/RimL family protein N-acetyltransferase
LGQSRGDEILQRHQHKGTHSALHYEHLQAENGYSVYTVLLKDISAVIGVCGFNPGENEEEAELLYHFNQHYWGKGYATELQLPVLLT